MRVPLHLEHLAEKAHEDVQTEELIKRSAFISLLLIAASLAGIFAVGKYQDWTEKGGIEYKAFEITVPIYDDFSVGLNPTQSEP